MEEDVRLCLIIIGLCVVLVVGIATFVGVFDTDVCLDNTELCQ